MAEQLRPIDPEFSSVYKAHRASKSKRGTHPLEGTDLQEWQGALKALGIGSIEELAKVLGISKKRAEVYHADPAKLPAKHFEKLYTMQREQSISLAMVTTRVKQTGKSAKQIARESMAFNEATSCLVHPSGNWSYRLTLSSELVGRLLVKGASMAGLGHYKYLLKTIQLTLEDNLRQCNRAIEDYTKMLEYPSADDETREELAGYQKQKDEIEFEVALIDAALSSIDTENALIPSGKDIGTLERLLASELTGKYCSKKSDAAAVLDEYTGLS